VVPLSVSSSVVSFGRAVHSGGRRKGFHTFHRPAEASKDGDDERKRPYDDGQAAHFHRLTAIPPESGNSIAAKGDNKKVGESASLHFRHFFRRPFAAMERPTAERTATDSSLLKSDPLLDLEDAPVKPLAFDDTLVKPSSRPVPSTWYGKVYGWVMTSDSVEAHGVGPLPEELRTDARFINSFTLWSVHSFSFALHNPR
jgi:hypothetical protein